MVKRSVIVAAAAAAVLCLTACAPHPAPTPTAHSRSTPRATPSASATPTLPPLAADVLFQISVTATAPNGAVAKLTETVHAPVAATDQQSDDEAQLDNECDSWRTAFSSTEFVVGQVSAVLVSGNWDSNQAIEAEMAGYPVWQGDQRPFLGFCASALPSIPGAARAVSPVGGGDADRNGGWAIYRYGFGVPNDPSAGDNSPSATDAVLSQCRIQLGSAAHDSAFASSWPSSAQTDNGLSCYFGGS
ncbi:MAG TPA: hypothetical protein VFQ74_11330 [Pseudolysinimonas sp.]|nr:hypothetical protein [Pseudolysinimonas sp.]